MKAVTSEFGTNAAAQDKLAAQNETLTKTIQKQEEKLAALQDGLAKSAEKYGEESTQTLKWQQAVNEATAALNKSKNQLDDNNRALEEMGDETNNVAKATEDLGEAQDRIGALGKVMLATLTAAAVAAGKAITDIVKSSLDAVGNYEQLVGGVETLFGDSAVKVLRNAADAYKTAGLSANDYMETVTSFSASLLQGLGGDTEKAADLANQALIDMADNANKMGTDMEAIQNAYQGFAKQNWTMLDNLKLGYGGSATEAVRLINRANELDSTILGVGQSIKKIDEVSFDQIIRAIHVVQDDLGITGTTAEEAATTIQGSMQAAKAAWDNFLSGAGDVNAFVAAFDTALDNVINNLKVIVPRVVDGLSQMVDKIMPLIPGIINDFLPVVIKGITSLVSGVVKALPKLLKTVGKALASNLESILTVAWVPVLAFQSKITEAFTKMPKTVSGSLQKIGTSIKTWATSLGGIVTIISAVVGGLTMLHNYMRDNDPYRQRMAAVKELTDSYAELKAAQEETISTANAEYDYTQQLADELMSIVDANGKVNEGYEARAEFIAGELSSALGIEIELVDGVIQNYGELAASIDKVIEKTRAEALLMAQEEGYREAVAHLNEYKQGMEEAAEQLAAAQQRMADAQNSMYSNPGIIAARQRELDAAQAYFDSMEMLYNGAMQEIQTYESDSVAILEGRYTEVTGYQALEEAAWQGHMDTTADIIEAGGEKMAAAAEGAVTATAASAQKSAKEANFESIGENMVTGMGQGMDARLGWLKLKAAQIALAAKRAAEQELGIQSPSKVFKQIGEYVDEGFAEGIEAKASDVTDAVKTITVDMQDLGADLLDRFDRLMLKNSENVKYDVEQNYAKLMLEADTVADFMELAAARQAKIVGENIDLANEGYKDNQELLVEWMNTSRSTIGAVDKYLSGGAAKVTRAVKDNTQALDNMETVSRRVQEVVIAAGFDKAGKLAAEGFATGLENHEAVQKVINKAKQLAQQALAALRAGLDEHSPSRAMEEIGELATEGFAIGLVNGLSSVRAAMTKTVNTVEEGMAGAVPTPQPTTASLVAGAVNGMASAAPTAGGGMLTVNLVMPDGKKLAQSTIKDFINVARANGTPITAY